MTKISRILAEAADDFFPRYARTMTEIGKERGWPKMRSSMFGDNSLKYYCMRCGTKHNQVACPKCGSKMKKVGS